MTEELVLKNHLNILSRTVFLSPTQLFPYVVETKFDDFEDSFASMAQV